MFPCKLPSLIPLFDVLHCTTTHQRPKVRWAKGSKPRWEQRPRTPEHRGLSHSLSCQTDRRKRRNTSRKISTDSVIYDDLCWAPRLPLTTRTQWFPSSSLSFLPIFRSTCLFLSVYLSVTFVHTCTPPSCHLPPPFPCTHLQYSYPPTIPTTGNKTEILPNDKGELWVPHLTGAIFLKKSIMHWLCISLCYKNLLVNL